MFATYLCRLKTWTPTHTPGKRKYRHALFSYISQTQPHERHLGVEEKTGDNWVERILRVRLMGLLLACVEDIVEAIPKSVGRVEEKADLWRIAPVGARWVRPIAAVGIQRRC
jgi:hypothetical protein